MSVGMDTFRYQYGDARPVAIAFDPTIGAPGVGYPISIGDMVYEDPQDLFRVKGADAFPWTTNLVTTQTNFAIQFLGISSQRWDGMNLGAYGIKDGLLRIDTGGVFLMACAAGTTLEPGCLVGPAGNTAGTALLPQTVAQVANKAYAIGWVVQAAVNASTVLVQLEDRATGQNVGSNILPTTTTSTTTTTTSTTTTSTTTTTAS